MKITSLFSLLTILTVAFMAGCVTAPRSLEQNAEKVRVVKNVSTNCKFLGQIKDVNIHGDVFPGASERDLALDDINYLKNEGEKLGANVVVLQQHQVTTKKNTVPTGRHKTGTYNVISHDILGNAYYCPTNASKTVSHTNQ